MLLLPNNIWCTAWAFLQYAQTHPSCSPLMVVTGSLPFKEQKRVHVGEHTQPLPPQHGGMYLPHLSPWSLAPTQHLRNSPAFHHLSRNYLHLTDRRLCATWGYFPVQSGLLPPTHPYPKILCFPLLNQNKALTYRWSFWAFPHAALALSPFGMNIRASTQAPRDPCETQSHTANDHWRCHWRNHVSSCIPYRRLNCVHSFLSLVFIKWCSSMTYIIGHIRGILKLAVTDEETGLLFF